MKDEHNINRSMRGAYNKMRAIAAELATNVTIESLTRVNMQLLREDVNELVQRFHEFNAYRNALGLPFPDDKHDGSVEAVSRFGKHDLPPSKQSAVDRFFAGSHERQGAKPVDGMDERFGFASDAVPDDEPIRARSMTLDREASLAQTPKHPKPRKTKPKPETVTFLPNTRDGSTSFQINVKDAKEMYATGNIAFDATNSCYCPPRSWTRTQLTTFRREYEVK